MILEAMELTRPCYAVVYVILLCALAKGGSEGRRSKTEEFHKTGDSLASSLHIDGKKVEQVWTHCKKELVERNNDVEDFDLHSLEVSSDIKSLLLVEKSINKAIKYMHPNVKQNLLDCIKKRTLTIPISGEEPASRHCLSKYFESLFDVPNGRGRYLGAESSDNPMAHIHAPAPYPGPALASPSHGSAPASFPPIEEPPKEASPSPPTPPHPKRSQPIPLPPQKGDPKDGNSQQNTIIFVATAAVILIALLFFCYHKGNSSKVDLKEAPKDDNPLLTVTLSDFSYGSQDAVGLENSDTKEPGINNEKNLSVVSSLSSVPANQNTSLAKTTSSEGMAQASSPALKPPPGRSAPPPPGPPPLPPAPAPRRPPPPRVVPPPPLPPKPMTGKNKPSPLGPLRCEQGNCSEGGEYDAPKAKLKPFFWDKVLAKPDQAMVWHEISAGSFQFNEEMMESLFGANQNKNERRKDSSSLEPSTQYIQIIDPRKAQNLSILLRALNVTTEEAIDALQEGNELPVELIQTFLKMAPTAEEELKLRLFTGDLSQLGPAERFLKVLVDIPFAFKRLESLLFMITFPEEAAGIKDYFATLEVASNDLRKSRLFLKLLEAVLKTGNRMNDGTYRGGAQAFRLDTLLKLSDVKGTDGKTTLLHFVVQEIIRSEGIRAARTEKASQSLSSVKTEDLVDENSEESAEHYRSLGLQVVSGLSSELEDVKKAAVIDGDDLTATVSKFGQSLIKMKEFLNTDLKNLDEDSEFHRSVASFVEKADADLRWLLEEEKRIMALVKNTADYFHGKSGKDEGLRLFVIVRDFLIILEKVCKEVKDTTMKSVKVSKTGTPSASSSPDIRPKPSDIHRRLFPAIVERRVGDSSSDDDDDDEDSDEDE